MKTSFVAALGFFAMVSASAAEAPFSQAFHGLSVSKLMSGRDYYPSRGMAPQTLNIYYTTANTRGLLTAGYYDANAPKDTPTQIRIYTSDILNFFKANSSKGYIPREISVTMSHEIPIFNVLWEKSPHPAALYMDMDDAGFEARYKEFVVNQGYRIAEHVVYTTRVSNRPRKRWHMAVFKKDGQGFYFHHGISAATFRNLEAHYKLTGYYANSISFAPTTEGEGMSVIFLKNLRSVHTYPDMTAQGYQDQFNRESAAGYHLVRVVGYHQGERFAAIWQKGY